ncbi:hypothetical protein [Nocardioides rubriscoriae]|uniref:hypothetical protein n=1 Tax=Nocardioides rubriscoriae TaxID=642762 RepID=UPI0011DF6BA3|nr:hypothetical protein [Nocardioides rubriscoriae]
MRLSRPLAAVSAAVILLSPAAAQARPDAAARPGASAPGQDKAGHFSFAVIGDVPYGADQIARFPGWIGQINAADPALTVHVGDIKNGSSRCDDGYYSLIRSDFDLFEGPLVYTPGDNEWTDCHRANNGAYQPLERLDRVRSVFFDHPGQTLGQEPMTVSSQAADGLPENVVFRRQQVDFAVVHVVGSNDDLQPWTGVGNTTATPAQVAEEQHRMAGAVAGVRSAFATARQRQDRAVALFLQADMFDPTYQPSGSDISAFAPLVQAIIDESSSFAGDVYLFNGDSHVYNSDHPLAPGSPLLARYTALGVTGSAAKVERITVDGSSNNLDWLKVTVNRPGAAEALSWERIPYTS